ncbi:hypothetical protein SEA_DAUDAU_80 [Streptomyces phage Daudau]|uniref:Uncharacterized protein n=1 Tax=Streptomyces phage Daudau TaxID=2041206 RepID=A0A291LHG1_9CAUD|nr:hypothetical protein KGG88_gp80 [Streptomyces phage Daudau]ATI18781.1 hypothetical protein SEA_DAUDAU_80 [Streptomyces phage Daudau]
MAITATFKTEAADAKGGLTLGELRKLLDAVDENAPDDAPIRVKVGWRSQITNIEIG